MGKRESEIIEAFEARKREAAADPRNDQDPPGISDAVAELAMKDYWTISEAANALCRCQPVRPCGLPGHEVLDKQVQRMRMALHRSTLAADAVNGDESLLDAREICRWARGRDIPLPEPLTCQFLADTEQTPSANGSSSENANRIRYLEQQKAILEAALAVVGRFHHQCVNTNRQVKAPAVARLIDANQATLFDTGVAPQVADQMARHIRPALNWNGED